MCHAYVRNLMNLKFVVMRHDHVYASVIANSDPKYIHLYIQMLINVSTT
jgi:hypothetical protein